MCSSDLLLSALSTKLAQNELTVLDKFEFDAPKTKQAQAFIDAFKFDKSVLVINDSNDKNIKLATANIKSLSIAEASDLNVYQVVANKNIVITQSAIKQLEEAHAE